jgi:hypothetical protein
MSGRASGHSADTKTSKLRAALTVAGFCRERLDARLRGLAYVRCLRTLLTFGDFEFHLVAFLQALISLGGNGAVVNKNIWSIRAPDEPVPFRVIEPLDGSFQTFHVPPSFRTSFIGGPKDVPTVKNPR